MIKWIQNNSTNIVASLYIILVQIAAGFLHVCKCWTTKDWPVKGLVAIDKISKKLISVGK